MADVKEVQHVIGFDTNQFNKTISQLSMLENVFHDRKVIKVECGGDIGFRLTLVGGYIIRHASVRLGVNKKPSSSSDTSL
jgi:hypothetical protein